MQQSDSKVIAETADGIGWITFNNPARRNAMSLEMWQLTDAALEAFERDTSVRVVVLRGAGEKAFMSGADISQFEDQRKNAEQQDIYAKTSEKAKVRLASFDKPLIAMIHGFCIGGGLGVAMSADIRIASADSRFGIPAAKLGLAYGFDSLRRLTDLVGPAYAKEILFTGRRLDAEESLRIGLVNRIVPTELLEATVIDLAAEIAASAPLTVRSAKITVDNIMRDPERRQMEKVHASFRACFDSDDYAEGRRAFMEKRKAVFTGT